MLIGVTTRDPMLTPLDILKYMWLVFGVYWLLSARHSSKSITHEVPWWRFGRLLILAATFMLLFATWLPVGPLAWRFAPQSSTLTCLGLAITFAGLVLCVSARLHLGTNWSDKVVLKSDHQLIRTGPYKFLRHPIYSGVLLAIVGTALAIGQWRGVAALAVMSINYVIKARREERILTTQFGDAYRDYQRTAGFLFPR